MRCGAVRRAMFVSVIVDGHFERTRLGIPDVAALADEPPADEANADIEGSKLYSLKPTRSVDIAERQSMLTLLASVKRRR